MPEREVRRGYGGPAASEPGSKPGPTVVIQHDGVDTVRYDISGDGPGSALTVRLVNASFFDLRVELVLPAGGERVIETPANTTRPVTIGQAGVVRIHAYGTDTPVGAVDGPVREIRLG